MYVNVYMYVLVGLVFILTQVKRRKLPLFEEIGNFRCTEIAGNHCARTFLQQRAACDHMLVTLCLDTQGSVKAKESFLLSLQQLIEDSLLIHSCYCSSVSLLFL